MSRPYRILGFSLIIAGAVFAPVSYFLLSSTALTATAISTLIVGCTCVGLANTRSYLSPEASRMILETGMENIASLLEELSLKNKAIYLPSALSGGKPRAIIPLKEAPSGDIRRALAGRLVVRFGSGADDLAIAVSTPGTTNLKAVKRVLGPNPSQIESAISHMLVGMLDLATAVSVSIADKRVNVEIRNPRLHWENVWYYRSLGSPLASVAAALSSEGLGKPVRIDKESLEKGKATVEIEVLG